MDLKRFFGIDLLDTIAGHGVPPAIVVMYVHGLPDTGLTSAIAAGGREFYGWGQDRHIAADLYDAITLNTEVSRDWTKRPDFERYPRPKSKTDEPQKKRTTVKDIFRQISQGGKK